MEGAEKSRLQMMATAKKRHQKGFKLTAEYKCRQCGFWHLTSQKQRVR